jgi:mannose-6-phosphate isomerase-like protein (cupin superfamily)
MTQQHDWHVPLAATLAQLPGAPTVRHPQGEPFAEVFKYGSLLIELFAPQGEDLQQPHKRDEWYVVARGTSLFERDGQAVRVQVGDFLFVPAQMPHRFVDFSSDFAVWVGFYGPQGGEAA